MLILGLRPARLQTRAGALLILFRHAIQQTAGDHRLTGQLAVDVGFALQAARRAAVGEHIHLDAKLIAGRDRAAEARPLDAGEDQQLVVAIGNFGKQQHRAGLRHRLDDQHSRHNGIAGKMAVKKWLVDRNVLNGDNSLGARDMKDAVDQQHRIAMRQKFENPVDLEL